MILFENIQEIELTGNELKNYKRKKRILHSLYTNYTLSATELSKLIGVSLPTALSMLKELSSLNLVEARGIGESKGGRKPMLFGLKKDSVLVISCELGRYKGRIGIFNAHNEAITPIEEFETHIDDPELTNKIHALTVKLVTALKIDVNKIYALGLAMPGLVDERSGINYTIKEKKLQNIKERLAQKFHRLVYVNNDARMQAYGEFIFGSARNHQNALIINWSWGIGLGMILDGKLYNGTTGFAGELSHIKFVDDGELCICGKRGCLETVTSAYVIINRAREAVQKGTVSQLTAKFKGRENELTLNDIICAAKSGDELAITLLNSVGQSLGKALANTIQLLNPDIIVIGGAVSQAKQHILTPIQQAINRHCLEHISSSTQIVTSKLWEQSGLLGLTAILYQNIFRILQ